MKFDLWKKIRGFTKAKQLPQLTVSIPYVDFFGNFHRKFDFIRKRYYNNFIFYLAEEVVKIRRLTHLVSGSLEVIFHQIGTQLKKLKLRENKTRNLSVSRAHT